MGFADYKAMVTPGEKDWIEISQEKMPKQWVDPNKERLDPATFAVLLSKIQYVARVIRDVILMSARADILNVANDYSTGIFD